VGTTTEAGAPAGTVAYGGGQYGAGDYGIGAADVAAYTSGGALSQKDAGGNVVTIPAGGNKSKYGAFIQIPISVDPVAIAYPPVYGETESAGGVITKLSLRVKKPNKDGSGGLLLDIPTLCAIFNGQIKNLNDKGLTALNGGTQLADVNDPNKGAGWSVPIQLVGRGDSSGTTSIAYRALAAQCGQGSITYTGGGDSYTYTNAYLPAGGKKLPTALIGGGYGTGTFLVETGSGAVAIQLGATIPDPGPGNTVYQAQIGYLGTDYVLPAVLRTGQNLFGLNVADLKPKGAIVGIEPTPLAALKAFGSSTNAILPPQSTTGGAFTTTPAANSHGTRAAAQDWAEPITTTITYSDGFTSNTPLADPDAYLGIVNAYPLVGTTNMFLNTCYADATVAADIVKFLEYYYDQKLVNDTSSLHFGVLEAAGLGPLPGAWNAAIESTFVTTVPTGVNATKQLNLNILAAGAGPTTGAGSQCSAVAPGA
jgi:ABC-type phosphate transport system substrate-binding protein